MRIEFITVICLAVKYIYKKEFKKIYMNICILVYKIFWTNIQNLAIMVGFKLIKYIFTGSFKNTFYKFLLLLS